MNDTNHSKRSTRADMPEKFYQFGRECLCLLYLNVLLYQISIIFLNLFCTDLTGSCSMLAPSLTESRV